MGTCGRCDCVHRREHERQGEYYRHHPEWDGQRRSSGWDLIAQTLIVPLDKPVLATFEVGVGSNVPDRSFVLRVYEWDRNVEHTTGAELFSSGPFASPVGTVEFMVFDIGIGLTGGAEYPVIVDWGLDGGDDSGVAFMAGSSYGDG